MMKGSLFECEGDSETGGSEWESNARPVRRMCNLQAIQSRESLKTVKNDGPNPCFNPWDRKSLYPV